MKPDNNHNLHQGDITLEGVDVEKLKRRICQDTMLLNLIMKQNKGKTAQTAKPDQTKEKTVQQNLSSSHDFIIEHMNNMMKVCNAKGFVYGIISEDGKPVTGASENLQGWWKERARFNDIAPEAIADYNVMKMFGGVMDHSNMSTPHILQKLHDTTLGCLLSTLIQHCDPPQRHYPLEKGVAPPWWPTGDEEWLSEISVDKEELPPPYRKPHYLKKVMKICVLMAVIRHMSPNMDKIHSVVMHSKRLQEKITAKEAAIILDAIKHEETQILRESSTFLLANNEAFMRHDNNENLLDSLESEYLEPKRKRPNENHHHQQQQQHKKQAVMLQRNEYPSSHSRANDDGICVEFQVKPRTSDHLTNGSNHQPLFGHPLVNRGAMSFNPAHLVMSHTAPLVNHVDVRDTKNKNFLMQLNNEDTYSARRFHFGDVNASSMSGLDANYFMVNNDDDLVDLLFNPDNATL